MSVPQIQIGKVPSEPLNVSHMLPLPADTPFGNLALKYLRIIDRLDRINVMVQRAYESHEKVCLQGIDGDLYEHTFLSEQIIYCMRKTVDELIGLYYVLDKREATGQYPNRVAPDSIGRLLSQKDVTPLFGTHEDFLRTLNDISNAYKHSFVNSDLGLIGRDEPGVYALGLKQNNLVNDTSFYTVPLSEVVLKFSNFFVDVVEELRKCKLLHQSP